MTAYFKRIDSMLESHEMPAEYQNTQSLIYCNDCETKSMTKFHFLYHKCNDCKGYNTKVVKTIEEKKQVSSSTANNSGLISLLGTTTTSELSAGESRTGASGPPL
jgi:hypothetical protein